MAAMAREEAETVVVAMVREEVEMVVAETVREEVETVMAAMASPMEVAREVEVEETVTAVVGAWLMEAAPAVALTAV